MAPVARIVFPPSFYNNQWWGSRSPASQYAASYWQGAVRINPGNSLVGDVPIFGNHQYGVISFWMRYEPSQATGSGWPRIGQDGNASMLPYFGTDTAYGTMGSIEIELVPISVNAVEFSSGAQ